ncbi:Beta-ketothiolase BktB [Paraburkholderia aspalathi]|uniref:beta-ketothiolase BktB n=1 Tax=Paraburkholderia aspalathi TaxID=1324617 RepID=UPI00190CA62C|nr:beta-ketothiolase BktB [Paraburkholderia aspalathi]MBK3842081.1 acetyl-CoA C-acyltransferase [Paraburkholderia aspalathi]CAE6820124.1 Beta-ketothiolase BktB [Paraburkholderia aspalathi]
MFDEVVVLSAVRTAIGDYGKALASVPPTELGALVVREALTRAEVQGEKIDQIVFGNVIHTEPADMYLARVAGINGGLSEKSFALTVNRLCGSGLQAILCGAQALALGDAEFVVAGGAESMSRAAYSMLDGRWGKRMGDAKVIDMMVGALTDPFEKYHMGQTAENVAAKFSISREQQDALAVESHRRAAAAISAGRFKSQIVPVHIRSKNAHVVFDTDEHVRGNITEEDLRKLKPAFSIEGTVTPGNASSLNDGAAAVVLATASAASRDGHVPLARLVSYGHSGVAPAYMGIGPVLAVRKALARARLTIGDIDLIEANEAFAAQACAVAQELQFDPSKLNPNGSGISLGHPIGATGAILVAKAVHELQRTGGRLALVTMCIGGGQGIAAVFERL